MKIGLNALYLIPGKVGGTEVYARRLVQALAPLGHELVVYVAAEAAGVFAASRVREVVCDVRAESRPARILFEQVRLPRLARRDGLDVLHSLGYTAPLRVPCANVVTVHDLNYHFHPEDWTRTGLLANRVLMPRVVRAATRVLTISQASRAALRDVLHVPDAKIDVVYHGVDGNLVERDDPGIHARLGLTGPYVLTVTASHPHKNLDGLIAAYEQLCTGWDTPPPLVVVGIRGRAHEALETRAARLARGRVVVTGWVDDAALAALYRNARVFAFPSKYEGFGFPVLEAMSVGVPVASSTATSLAELVGDAAVTFDPERPAEIAAAIRRAYEDEPLRAQLIERGYAQAARFTWARCARETIDVYRRALGIAPQT